MSTAFFLGVGSRHEPDGVQGICHFIEHMLFKGTHTRPTPKDVSIAIEQLGGILNAETGKEITVYWNKVAQRHWRTAIEIQADVLRNSLFDPTEIEKERAVIVEELSMLFDSPTDWVHLLIDEAVWGTHPLGRDVGGTRDSVLAISRQDMLQFVNCFYSPENAVVAIAGPVDHDAVVADVERRLGDWPRQTDTRHQPVDATTNGPGLIVREKETEQAHLCLAVPGVSYVHPDRFALDLLNVILGEGMSSRLFLEVRERLGLAYDVHSYVNRFRDTGSLVVYAGVDPERIGDAIQAVLDELAKLCGGIPDDEIVRAKDFWKGRMDLRLEETRSLASWMGSQEILLDRVYSLDEIVAQIDAVTPDDLIRVASTTFNRASVRMAVIGPFDDPTPFRKFLAP